MTAIMSGEASSAQLAGFLVALRAKGETADEVTGLVRVMRRFAVPVPVSAPTVDTCGTGGGAVTTFNISTAAALLAAGAVRIPEITHYPLADAAKAHEISEGRHLRGKLVLDVR